MRDMRVHEKTFRHSVQRSCATRDSVGANDQLALERRAFPTNPADGRSRFQKSALRDRGLLTFCLSPSTSVNSDQPAHSQVNHQDSATKLAITNSPYVCYHPLTCHDEQLLIAPTSSSTLFPQHRRSHIHSFFNTHTRYFIIRSTPSKAKNTSQLRVINF